jgi:hypothetical protein
MKRTSGPRKSANLSESTQRQLNMYALAAGAAGVGILTLAQGAEAKIIYTPAHRSIGAKTFIDLNHDGVTDFNITLVRTSHCEGGCTTSGVRHGTAFQVTYAFLSGVGVVQGNQLYGQGKLASALPAGVRVGPKSKFPGGNRMAEVSAISGNREGYSGAWAGTGGGVQHRFLGLKFKIHGKTHFGWARFDVTLSPQGANIEAKLTGYAYETIPNKPIITGKTKGPEEVEGPDASLAMPSSEVLNLGQLAVGWSGVSAWRREEPGRI